MLRSETTPTPAVELWSVRRLPFEPKGWVRDMRDELRAAVLALPPAKPGQMLEAVYTSPVLGFCDVENVVLYNVGPSSFHSLATHGLRVERRFSAVIEPRELKGLADHHWRYASVPQSSESGYWRSGAELAEWSFAPPPLRGDLHPADVWIAMRRGDAAATAGSSVPSRFGVDVSIDVPAGSRCLVANVIKPLLDGVLSALHAHDCTKLDEVAERISAALVADAGEIRGYLTSNPLGVLGERTLVRPHGQGVQWNPADDGCVLAEVRLKAGSKWHCSGRLFEVRPRLP